MNTRVFLYGTLKRGQRSHHLVGDQEFVREAKTVPRYRLFDCGQHPALVDDPQNGVAVHGEIWLVNDETLQKLDDYEGLPDYFSRGPILLQGWDLPVQAYFFNGDVSILKDCGERWPPKIEDRG